MEASTQTRNTNTEVTALRIFSVFGLLVVILLIFSWPAFFQEEAELTFSVSATVEVDGQMYSGTSVWHMRNWIVKFPARSPVYSEVRGEAIHLTGGGRNLFILRKAVGGGSGTTYGDFPESCAAIQASPRQHLLPWLREEFTGPCELIGVARVLFPVLVEVPDLSRPESARELTYDVPAQAGGSCLSPCLVSLTVERSDGRISTGIEELIPALAGLATGMASLETGETVSWHPETVGSFVLLDFSTELRGHD